MTTDSIWCEECDEEFEVEADISFTTERHPYGSTTAEERLVEIDGGPWPDTCPNCGHAYDEQRALDRLIERAADERYD